MHFEEFAEGGSFLHRMDPRVKVVSLAVFAAVVAVSRQYAPLSAALLFSALMVGAAGLNMGQVFRRLVVVNAFVVFLWAVLPFTMPGEPVLRLWSVAATREGVSQAALITLKTNAIILATIALLGTSPIFSLVHALVHLKAPDKLVHLFFFCYRYISVMHLEYSRLRAAMKVRCFRPGTTVHTYRSLAYLLGMLFVKGFDRSERIYKAMLCRGFNGRFHTLHHFRLRPSDVVSLTAVCGFSAWLALWQILGAG